MYTSIREQSEVMRVVMSSKGYRNRKVSLCRRIKNWLKGYWL